MVGRRGHGGRCRGDGVVIAEEMAMMGWLGTCSGFYGRHVIMGITTRLDQ
ncbi:hypothetical protein SESBI_50830 [Sesbania bispinosa]|nr:hypothetical protein SESBI_50830 [Sesbania bispinosa]